MRLVIDRFEGGFAVCDNWESGEIVNLPKSVIPSEACDGDIIEICVVKDCERSLRIEEKMNDLWK